MKKEEYELITKTTCYAFWKLNKAYRQLKNVIKQEIRLFFHWIKYKIEIYKYIRKNKFSKEIKKGIIKLSKLSWIIIKNNHKLLLEKTNDMFVTTATGGSLDMLAMQVGYKRNKSEFVESDEIFIKRILDDIKNGGVIN